MQVVNVSLLLRADWSRQGGLRPNNNTVAEWRFVVRFEMSERVRDPNKIKTEPHTTKTFHIFSFVWHKNNIGSRFSDKNFKKDRKQNGRRENENEERRWHARQKPIRLAFHYTPLQEGWVGWGKETGFRIIIGFLRLFRRVDKEYNRTSHSIDDNM